MTERNRLHNIYVGQDFLFHVSFAVWMQMHFKMRIKSQIKAIFGPSEGFSFLLSYFDVYLLDVFPNPDQKLFSNTNENDNVSCGPKSSPFFSLQIFLSRYQN